ncbi:MAG: PD-(D/E)XK nuclease family protein, partial [Bacteroidaceae bacterium]|nr:PD-(D/E)XK nuclease family protein [Bacteroidaceae bacterium]
MYDLIYLTLDGKDASKDSGDGVKYIKMSYAKDIIKWLDMCIMHSAG